MDVVNQLEDKDVVTIAAGTSCGSLGDERNLREFLVASEVADSLRRVGHVVHLLLFNDNLDPLSEAQLRVAVNKDPAAVEQFKPYCGKPICSIPDPFGCHESLSRHFEKALMDRLHRLGCHPTLINTSDLYRRGIYRSFVTQTLQRAGEMTAYCAEEFDGYQPERLYYVLCPVCGYLDSTTIEVIGHDFLRCSCDRCGHQSEIPVDQLQGKLNYKIECAARWKVFDVDAEPFGKAYMEPRSGSFHVSLGLGKRFFEGRDVIPLAYGQVKVNRDISYRVIESFPGPMVRSMLLERPHADIALSRERVVLAASRMETDHGMTYLDLVKQLVPAWLLNPTALNSEQRELLTSALNFAVHMLKKPVEASLPHPEMFDGESIEVLRSVRGILRQTVTLRQTVDGDFAKFRASIKELLSTLGALKHSALHRLRVIAQQSHGLPASRFLYHLPIDYIQLLDYILSLKISSMEKEPISVAARMLIEESASESTSSRALLSD